MRINEVINNCYESWNELYPIGQFIIICILTWYVPIGSAVVPKEPLAIDSKNVTVIKNGDDKFHQKEVSGSRKRPHSEVDLGVLESSSLAKQKKTASDRKKITEYKHSFLGKMRRLLEVESTLKGMSEEMNDLGHGNTRFFYIGDDGVVSPSRDGSNNHTGNCFEIIIRQTEHPSMFKNLLVKNIPTWFFCRDLVDGKQACFAIDGSDGFKDEWLNLSSDSCFFNEVGTFEKKVVRGESVVGNMLVLGDGQFTKVFTIRNMTKKKALRRFSSFRDKREMCDFIYIQRLSLMIYEEFGIPYEETYFIFFSNVNEKGETIDSVYMVQPIKDDDQKAGYYLEEFFKHEAEDKMLLPMGEGNEPKEVAWSDVMGHVLAATIKKILKNLKEIDKSRGMLASICADIKMDNLSVSFSDKHCCADGIDVSLKLFDHIPCTLIIKNEAVFDGGEESEKMRCLFGESPYDGFKEKIKDLPDAERLVLKMLSNIKVHGRDKADAVMKDVIVSVKRILEAEWKSPDFIEMYESYQVFPNPKDFVLASGVKLFFDLSQLTVERVDEYYEKSRKANKKLKLLKYLSDDAFLSKSADKSPFYPVTTEQIYWLNTVRDRYKDEIMHCKGMDAVMTLHDGGGGCDFIQDKEWDAIYEVYKNCLVGAVSDKEKRMIITQNVQRMKKGEGGADCKKSIMKLVDDIIEDVSIEKESKIRWLIDYHKSKKGDVVPMADRNDFSSIQRDTWIEMVDRKYGEKLSSIAILGGDTLNELCNTILDDKGLELKRRLHKGSESDGLYELLDPEDDACLLEKCLPVEKTSRDEIGSVLSELDSSLKLKSGWMNFQSAIVSCCGTVLRPCSTPSMKVPISQYMPSLDSGQFSASDLSDRGVLAFLDSRENYCMHSHDLLMQAAIGLAGNPTDHKKIVIIDVSEQHIDPDNPRVICLERSFDHQSKRVIIQQKRICLGDIHKPEFGFSHLILRAACENKQDYWLVLGIDKYEKSTVDREGSDHDYIATKSKLTGMKLMDEDFYFAPIPSPVTDNTLLEYKVYELGMNLYEMESVCGADKMKRGFISILRCMYFIIFYKHNFFYAINSIVKDIGCDAMCNESFYMSSERDFLVDELIMAMIATHKKDFLVCLIPYLKFGVGEFEERIESDGSSLLFILSNMMKEEKCNNHAKLAAAFLSSLILLINDSCLELFELCSNYTMQYETDRFLFGSREFSETIFNYLKVWKDKIDEMSSECIEKENVWNVFIRGLSVMVRNDPQGLTKISPERIGFEGTQSPVDFLENPTFPKD